MDSGPAYGYTVFTKHPPTHHMEPNILVLSFWLAHFLIHSLINMLPFEGSGMSRVFMMKFSTLIGPSPLWLAFQSLGSLKEQVARTWWKCMGQLSNVELKRISGFMLSCFILFFQTHFLCFLAKKWSIYKAV